MKERIRTLEKELELEQVTEQIRTIEEEELEQLEQQIRALDRTFDEELDPLIVQHNELEASIAKKNGKAKPAMERRNAWHKLDVWKSGCIAQERELEVCAQCAAEPFVCYSSNAAVIQQ